MNEKNTIKLALGTAQLGQEYGIANQTGIPDRADALRILGYAISNGMDTIDTAPVYGRSEDIIGEFIEKQKKAGLKEPHIITKIPPVNQSNKVISENVHDYLLDSITSSLKRLRTATLDVCLLHSPGDMTALDGMAVSSLIKMKQEGMIKEIGVSVYSPEEARKAIDLDCFDIVEAPINIFDHRLIVSGLLNQLLEHQIKVYARSVFLQGLVFLNPDNLPEELKIAKVPLKKLKRLSLETGLKPDELSLLFVRDIIGIDKIVIGCETLEQLKKNIDIINLPRLDEKTKERIAVSFIDISENIINPTMWRGRRFWT